jgi:hypothetical protein
MCIAGQGIPLYNLSPCSIFNSGDATLEPITGTAKAILHILTLPTPSSPSVDQEDRQI